MDRLVAGIRKYSRRIVSGAERLADRETPAAAAILAAECETRAPLQPPVGHAGNDCRGTPDRVLRRPDPAAWSPDELLALHEAVALLWPRGPLTVSSLRTAAASGQLACARIAGRLYTTRAALAAMTECRKAATAGGGSGSRDDTDWDARLAKLLPGRGGGAR
jgi:hypothetical protein